jgi:hypothetical protein
VKAKLPDKAPTDDDSHAIGAGNPPELLRAKPYPGIEDLAALTPFTEDAIRTKVKRNEFVEGIHYFRVGRRLVFKWQAIVDYIEKRPASGIPLHRGGFLGEPAKT